MNEKNVDTIKAVNEKKVAVIQDIRFKGKRSINWDDVRQYLKRYVGQSYIVIETADVIHMGSDLPNEYTGSNYTYKLKGGNAKAKANAAQGLPEMVKIASGKSFRSNNEQKHEINAKYGWYRYDSRFVLPIYDGLGKIERYNTYHASLIVRHDANGKMYLYDIIDIKKETSNPLKS